MVEVEIVFGAGKGDVEEAAFFVEAFGGCESHVGGDGTVGHVEDMDRVELETFCRVDRAEDEAIFLVAVVDRALLNRGGGIEGEVGEELGAVGVGFGHVFELLQVEEADRRVVVAAFDEWGVELPDESDLLAGAGLTVDLERKKEACELGPEFASGCGGFEVVPGAGKSIA